MTRKQARVASLVLAAVATISLVVAFAAIPVAAFFFQHASIEGVLSIAVAAAALAAVAILAGSSTSR